MRRSTLLLSLVFIGSCTQKPGKVTETRELSRPTIRIIEASFPLYLDSVLVTEAGTSPSPKLDRALQGLVEDFYFNQCAGDSNETFSRMTDTHLFTVKMHGHESDYYLMVMQQVPQSFVTGRLIKWDQREERITSGPIDVPLSAMYEVQHGRLQPSNLKTQFKIIGPELEIKDTLGQESVVVQRLWHNGTFNSNERTVLGFDQDKVDTLYSSRRPI